DLFLGDDHAVDVRVVPAAIGHATSVPYPGRPVGVGAMGWDAVTDRARGLTGCEGGRLSRRVAEAVLAAPPVGVVPAVGHAAEDRGDEEEGEEQQDQERHDGSLQ